MEINLKERHDPSVFGQSSRKISIIVPVFNEEWSVIPLFAKISNASEHFDCQWEVIFVNDGSTDKSAENLNQLAVSSTNVKVIHLRRNFGITRALQAGFDNASGAYIVTISASLQNDPKDIVNLIQKIDEGFDICVGWRILVIDRALKREKPRGLLNKLISRISGVPLHDYECLLRAYRAPMLKSLKLYGQSSQYIPIFLSWRGGSIAEIPVNNYPRSHEKFRQKNFFRRNLKTMLDLTMLKFLERYSERPLYFFGALGALNLVAALCTFFTMVYLKYGSGTAFIQTPLPVVASLFLLTGVLLLVLGVMSEFQTRIFQSSTQVLLYDIEEKVGFPPINQ